jgi:hypothetical protein
VHWILWRILWTFGYALTAVWPCYGRVTWTAIVVLGLAVGFPIGFRAAVRRDAQVNAPADPPRPGSVAQFRWGFPGIMRQAG